MKAGGQKKDVFSLVSEAELCLAALDAMKYAYVPYSRHTVGAALLTTEGKIYKGCNIENAAYGPTNCAERTAIFKAVSEGERSFAAIAICGGLEGQVNGLFPPCGVCRQVMREFCPLDFPILLIEKREPLVYQRYTLRDLLPVSFGPEDL